MSNKNRSELARTRLIEYEKLIAQGEAEREKRRNGDSYRAAAAVGRPGGHIRRRIERLRGAFCSRI